MPSIAHAGNVDPSISTEFKHISIFSPFYFMAQEKAQLIITIESDEAGGFGLDLKAE